MCSFLLLLTGVLFFVCCVFSVDSLLRSQHHSHKRPRIFRRRCKRRQKTGLTRPCLKALLQKANMNMFLLRKTPIPHVLCHHATKTPEIEPICHNRLGSFFPRFRDKPPRCRASRHHWQVCTRAKFH